MKPADILAFCLLRLAAACVGCVAAMHAARAEGEGACPHPLPQLSSNTFQAAIAEFDPRRFRLFSQKLSSDAPRGTILNRKVKPGKGDACDVVLQISDGSLAQAYRVDFRARQSR
jgi:hypothetical protein